MHGSARCKRCKAVGAREINGGRRQKIQPRYRAQAEWPLQKTHFDAVPNEGQGVSCTSDMTV